MISIKVPSNEEWLFFISYGIYLTYSILYKSFYAKYIMRAYGIILWISFALLAVCEVQKSRYTFREILKAMLAILISIYMYFIGNGEFAAIFIFVYCGRKIDFKRIARFTILVSSIMLVFIISSAFLGIIPNVAGTHGEKTRLYLGFRYGLYGPCFLFNITALVIYVKGSMIKWKHILLLFLLNFEMFLLADARLSFYMVLMVLFAAIILKYFPNILIHLRVLCLVPSLSYVVIGLFSVYAIINYNSSAWLSKLNEICGTRLYLGNISMMRYGVSLFGNKDIVWIGNGLDYMGNKASGTYLYVDNLYFQIMQRYGIIFFIVYILLFTLVLFRCLKKEENYLFMILVALAVRGFVDDLSLQLYYNTFWLVVGRMLFSSLNDGQTYMKQMYKNNPPNGYQKSVERIL